MTFVFCNQYCVYTVSKKSSDETEFPLGNQRLYTVPWHVLYWETEQNKAGKIQCTMKI